MVLLSRTFYERLRTAVVLPTGIKYAYPVRCRPVGHRLCLLLIGVEQRGESIDSSKQYEYVLSPAQTKAGCFSG